MVINADTLMGAWQSGCDLWKEATACQHQIITLAPETLRTPQFNDMIWNDIFRARWGVLTVDEAHLTYMSKVHISVSYMATYGLCARAHPNT